jgi:hypothetical protein
VAAGGDEDRGDHDDGRDCGYDGELDKATALDASGETSPAVWNSRFRHAIIVVHVEP